jgi:hypothetical protein
MTQYPYPDFNRIYSWSLVAPTRAAWQCPACKTHYAPHVDKCECQKPLPSPQGKADD